MSNFLDSPTIDGRRYVLPAVIDTRPQTAKWRPVKVYKKFSPRLST